MTLLIAAKCNDGILLTADSAKRDGFDGPWSSGGIKWIVGERDDRFFGLVFGGDAMITDHLSTHELLTNACRLSGQDLCLHVANSIKDSIEQEYQHGPFNSPGDRDNYGNTAGVGIYLAPNSAQLYKLTINRHGGPITLSDQLEMDMFDLEGPKAVRAHLQAMRKPCAAIIDAADIIGSMFEYACANLKAARFPGIAVWVQPTGVKIVKFNSRGDLLAGLAQP